MSLEIRLKPEISQADYDAIRGLEKACADFDGTSFKLELEYKLAQAGQGKRGLDKLDEFLCYNGGTLAGYIGVCDFGGGALEINGMTHPDYRRRGIFTALFDLARMQAARRGKRSALLLCDRRSPQGKRFIEKTGAAFDHTEYEMLLGKNPPSAAAAALTLRRAQAMDADEVSRQDAIFDNLPEGSANHARLEELESGGMLVYMAEAEGRVVGKVHLELIDGAGGIYGLGILPEYRGRGLGRALLLAAVARLRDLNAGPIRLQVDAQNDNALHIYTTCGFEPVYTMDYYLLNI